MTHEEHEAGAGTRLDAALRELPREHAPARDLWPQIAARIDDARAVAPAAGRPRWPGWRWQAAAAVLLVAGSSLLTATLLDRNVPAGQAAVIAPPAAADPVLAGVVTMPAAFGPAGTLDPEYLAARQQLTQVLEQRIAALPPSTRAKLEFNLGEMRRAADEINAALAGQPGDPLLEELLLSTYQDELAMLANVNQLTNSLGAAQATPTAERMQL
jgi:hypothetical protein